MGVKYSCYNKCHIRIFNPIDSLRPYISSCGGYIRPALITLGVMVPRAALGVRVPGAHARRVATPSDLINLNQGVRVPWTVPIARPIIFTLNEYRGMKVI
jgi:hypothetical protein